ncbi:SMC-Scp complex subunit ScpB [Micromonospora sp. A200]|uniref:SMC-Scp complex subunit ScpB n=1 Tax=Micromonospora sp. A200 TaxID=2940568 RepID=UPI002477133C|nr:SMC-Scp complex subunit ScpB [Micromonospora sp. A200]
MVDAANSAAAAAAAVAPASAPAERPGPEILDTYRSPETETVQDLADGDPAPVPPAGPAVTGHGGPTEPTDAGGTDAGAANVRGTDAGETDADSTSAGGADIGGSDAGGTGAEPAGAGADRAAPPVADPDAAGSAEDLPGEGAAARVPGKQPAPRRRATPAPEPTPVLDDAELRGALEAILLVVDEPVSELTLAQVLEQPAERVGPMLDEIAAGYTAAGHGFELRRAAGGWRLYTRPEYATYVERFVLDGQSVRLTQAALETLAVIAYKQPVTRSRISAIRGVNCDGVIRTLVSRGLVEECGTEPDSGAFLYRTTTMFLEKLGLNSVDDLPPLAPFLPDDVEELADATR